MVWVQSRAACLSRGKQQLIFFKFYLRFTLGSNAPHIPHITSPPTTYCKEYPWLVSFQWHQKFSGICGVRASEDFSEGGAEHQRHLIRVLVHAFCPISASSSMFNTQFSFKQCAFDIKAYGTIHHSGVQYFWLQTDHQHWFYIQLSFCMSLLLMVLLCFYTYFLHCYDVWSESLLWEAGNVQAWSV